jgi:hypothetical protein
MIDLSALQPIAWQRDIDPEICDLDIISLEHHCSAFVDFFSQRDFLKCQVILMNVSSFLLDCLDDFRAASCFPSSFLAVFERTNFHALLLDLYVKQDSILLDRIAELFAVMTSLHHGFRVPFVTDPQPWATSVSLICSSATPTLVLNSGIFCLHLLPLFLDAHPSFTDMASEISAVLSSLSRFSAQKVQTSLIYACALRPSIFCRLFRPFLLTICDSFHFDTSRLSLLTLSLILRASPDLRHDLLTHPLFALLLNDQDRLLSTDSFLLLLTELLRDPSGRRPLIAALHWPHLLSQLSSRDRRLVILIPDLLALACPDLESAGWTRRPRRSCCSGSC